MLVLSGKILGILLLWGCIHYMVSLIISHFNDFEGKSISRKTSIVTSSLLTVCFIVFCICV